MLAKKHKTCWTEKVFGNSAVETTLNSTLHKHGNYQQTFLLFVCIYSCTVQDCVCIYVGVYAGTCAHVCVYTETRDWHQVSSWIIAHINYWGRVSCLNLDLAVSLPSQLCSRDPLPLPPVCWCFRQAALPTQHLCGCCVSRLCPQACFTW